MGGIPKDDACLPRFAAALLSDGDLMITALGHDRTQAAVCPGDLLL